MKTVEEAMMSEAWQQLASVNQPSYIPKYMYMVAKDRTPNV